MPKTSFMALELTGQQGDVMKESMSVAKTVAWNLLTEATKADLHAKSKENGFGLHIHCPDGGTPKDGPSAGIGMCTALVSVLTSIPVKADVAMTGEITLQGQVLRIGGLKEKLLAAHRGNIKTVVIPADNERDLAEIPDNIKEDLKIVPVKWIDEVLETALQFQPTPLRSKEKVVKKKKSAQAEIDEPESESTINTH